MIRHLGLNAKELCVLMGSAATSETQAADTTGVQKGAPNSTSSGDAVHGWYVKHRTQGS